MRLSSRFYGRLLEAGLLNQNASQSDGPSKFLAKTDVSTPFVRLAILSSLRSFPSTHHFFSTSHNQSPHQFTAPPHQQHVLYKGRGMRPLRLLVRLKIFQLTGVAALAIPISSMIKHGSASGLDTLIAAGLLTGSFMAAATLWFYSRRYLGELSLLSYPSNSSSNNNNNNTIGINTSSPPSSPSPPSPPSSPSIKLKLSVMDFWGKREDVEVDIARLIPPFKKLPLETARQIATTDVLMPLKVQGDRQYIISLRYGHIVDMDVLWKLMEGKLPGQEMV